MMHELSVLTTETSLKSDGWEGKEAVKVKLKRAPFHSSMLCFGNYEADA